MSAHGNGDHAVAKAEEISKLKSNEQVTQWECEFCTVVNNTADKNCQTCGSFPGQINPLHIETNQTWEDHDVAKALSEHEQGSRQSAYKDLIQQFKNEYDEDSIAAVIRYTRGNRRRLARQGGSNSI